MKVTYCCMERKFKREINALDDVFDFVENYSSANAIDPAFLFSIKFVIEELFTNMVKYNVSDSQSDISIGLQKENHRLVIQLIDYDVDAFDMSGAKDADITQSLQERKIGGLGIHLVKKMVDAIDYEYVDRKSIITLTKNLG